jgi:hydroxyacylglutathione hydrolase
MVSSLTKLRRLPDQTKVWCAHEYTLSNLKFALTVDGDNSDLQQRFAEVKAARSLSQPTISSIRGVEKRTNPFLRWDMPALQLAVDSQDPVQTFARVRRRKDMF